MKRLGPMFPRYFRKQSSILAWLEGRVIVASVSPSLVEKLLVAADFGHVVREVDEQLG
jgi:hypothetical protein